MDLIIVVEEGSRLMAIIHAILCTNCLIMTMFD